MNLVESAKHILVKGGAQWVMWVLIALSVLSVGVMLERAYAFWIRRDDIDRLRRGLSQALDRGGFDEARLVMRRSQHPAARVALRGMRAEPFETSAEEAEQGMAAEAAAQKSALETRLGFLGTLGANAPFIGLFGTVIGIVQAFEELGKSTAITASASAMAPQAVMSSIAEALVATAVGIGVAIPAVFAFNHFLRASKRSLAGADMLSRELLAFLRKGRTSSPSSVAVAVSDDLQEAGRA